MKLFQSQQSKNVQDFVFCQSSSIKIILWIIILRASLMGSKWEYNSPVLIGSNCLWIHRCAAGGTFFGYCQIKGDSLQRAGAHLRSKRKSYKHTVAHTHIWRFAHMQVWRQTGSIHLKHFTLADFQPLQTETCQHHRTPSTHDRRLYGTSQITVVLLQQLLTFQSLLSPHIASIAL